MPRSLSTRLTFCGKFQGFKTEAHQLAVRISATIVVEVYRKGSHWLVKERTSSNDFPNLIGTNPKHACDLISARFETQIGDWEAYDSNGKLHHGTFDLAGDFISSDVEPPLSQKAISTPRDRYGIKGM